MLCISTWFLCDRTTELIELVLAICVFLIIWRDLTVGSERRKMRKHCNVFVESALA